VPEVLDLEQQLDTWGISREGLVDLAILVGTDFNDGIKGIGPKKALKLVQDHGRIENMPAAIRDAVGDVEDIREIYLRPNVVDVPMPEFGQPDRDAIARFLCESRQFSTERVTNALDRAFPSPSLF
jgi:flap endonuclease-1